jgi:uncharacterized membrane protein YqjE
LLGGLLDLGRTRIELAAVELAEERVRIAQLFIAAVITMFLLALGLLLSMAWLLLWCDPAQRLTVLGGLALACVLAGALSAWRWQAMAGRMPPFLQATLAELARDHAALTDRGNA